MREMLSVFWGICGARGRFAGLCGLVRAAGRRVARSFVAVLVVLSAAVFVAGCAGKPQCRHSDPADCPPRAVLEVPSAGAWRLTRLVEEDPDVDWVGIVPGEAYTLLHYVAAGANDDGLVDLLIDKGADVNARDRYYASTPLHLAAQYGEPDVVAALIARGADIDARDIDGQTPYLAASSITWRSDPVENLEVLAMAGADTAAVDFNGNTALHLAPLSHSHQSVKIVAYLIENGADVNARNNDGDTPMHRFRNIRSPGADRPMNTFDKFEGSWLQGITSAAYELGILKGQDRRIKFYQMLTDNGAEIEISNNAGYEVKKTEHGFALFGSFGEKYGEKCDFTAGACFGVDWTEATVEDARNVNLHLSDGRRHYRGVGWMPFHYAAAHSGVEVVRAMIARGANVHYGPYGFSPLHVAANRDTAEVASVLLATGANPRAKVDYLNAACGFFTPLHFAHQKDVVALLVEAAPDTLYARANNGRRGGTALHFLAGGMHNVAEQNPDTFIRLLETAGVGTLNLIIGDAVWNSNSVLDLVREKDLSYEPFCSIENWFFKEVGNNQEGHARLMTWLAEQGYDKADPPAEFLLLD